MFETIKNWLLQMNLSFGFNEKLKLFHLPYDIDGLKFGVNIIINPDNKWIKVAALLITAEKVPQGLDQALLNANWHLFDVTYSRDDNGNIYSENDIPAASNFENFESEFGAVVFGVTYFFNQISPKYNLKKQETFKRESRFEYL